MLLFFRVMAFFDCPSVVKHNLIDLEFVKHLCNCTMTHGGP